MASPLADRPGVGQRARLMALILGLESSCDDSAAALVTASGKSSPRRWSARTRRTSLSAAWSPKSPPAPMSKSSPALIRQVLAEAGTGVDEVDAIAATAGPGLIGGVMVGLLAGKGLALASGKPLIAVNHLEGHALSPRLADPDLDFPYLLLLVSGGHCQLLEVRGVGDYRRLATTIDDAAGEAFDKAAKLLGLRLSRRARDRSAGPRRRSARRSRCRVRCSARPNRISPSPASRARSSARSRRAATSSRRHCRIASSRRWSIAWSIAPPARSTEASPTLVVAGGVAANTPIRTPWRHWPTAKTAHFRSRRGGCAPTMRR